MIKKLDLKDKKLLFELDMDARQTNAKIAKKLGISKQSVQYRINSLIKRGIIKGFYPVINVPKLGYLYCRISIALKDITEKERELMLDELKNNKRIFWIFTTQGIYDILMVPWVKSVTEFRNIIDGILFRYGKYIQNINESIATDVIHYQHKYLLRKKQTKEIHIKETKKYVKIDELDKKILIKLCDNARYSLIELANLLNESSKVISYRIKRMEKKGLIEGYRCIIDHKKLGYTYYKLWINLHNLSKNALKRLKEIIKNNPKVIYLVEGVGFPEYLDIEVMVKNSLELYDFIKKLRNTFPHMIGNYKMFMFIDTVKVRYYPF